MKATIEVEVGAAATRIQQGALYFSGCRLWTASASAEVETGHFRCSPVEVLDVQPLIDAANAETARQNVKVGDVFKGEGKVPVNGSYLEYSPLGNFMGFDSYRVGASFVNEDCFYKYIGPIAPGRIDPSEAK